MDANEERTDLTDPEKSQLKLAVLISGTGRTLKNFIDLAAEGTLPVEIRLVVSSTAKAGGLKFAEAAGIPTRVILRGDFPGDAAGDIAYGEAVFAACREASVDYVAMAGFLKLAPLPDDFMGRVLNIHPALIPGFCGPGMYGPHVHQAVLDAGVRVTGCTVHFVDNQYDHGPIIWQQPVPVFDDDTAGDAGRSRVRGRKGSISTRAEAAGGRQDQARRPPREDRHPCPRRRCAAPGLSDRLADAAMRCKNEIHHGDTEDTEKRGNANLEMKIEKCRLHRMQPKLCNMHSAIFRCLSSPCPPCLRG